MVTWCKWCCRLAPWGLGLGRVPIFQLHLSWEGHRCDGSLQPVEVSNAESQTPVQVEVPSELHQERDPRSPEK